MTLTDTGLIMRNLLIALTLIATLAACGKDEQATQTQVPDSAEVTQVAETAPEKSESERLNQWFELRFEEQLQFSPIALTIMGRKELYDEVDDLSEAAEDAQLAWQRNTVEEMERDFDYDKLTPEAKISYEIWKYQYEDSAKGAAFRDSGYVFTQMQGAQSMVPTLMINFHSVDDRSDMEAYIKRIGGMSRALKQLYRPRAKICRERRAAAAVRLRRRSRPGAKGHHRYTVRRLG
jgi:uncharacterized protein (DUF885 family)